MKSCPACNRIYADDTITFCLVDGSILSAPYDPHAPQPYRHPQNEPPPTEILPSVAKPADTIPTSRYSKIPAPPPSFKLAVERNQGQKRRISKRSVVIIAAVLFVTILGLVMIVSRNVWSGKDNFASNNSATTFNASNNHIAATSETSATPANSRTSKTEKSPGNTNMMGTWVGKSAGWRTTLVINSQEGNSFSGTKHTGNYQAAFNGNIDSISRQVMIRETSLLKGALPIKSKLVLDIG
jgi:hypothetical protein